MAFLDYTGLSHFLDKLKTIFPVLDSNSKVQTNNLPTMTGATSSAAGTAGIISAPAAGDNIKFLKGDGTWDVVDGSKVYSITGTITNVSGSYSSTITDTKVSADMKPIRLQLGTPSIFGDDISVACNNGNVVIACNDVAGTSTFVLDIISTTSDPSTVTSTEYNILNNAKLDKDQGAANAGKVLTVTSTGNVEAMEMGSGLPSVTAADNGKILMVVNGEWAVIDADATGVSF